MKRFLIIAGLVGLVAALGAAGWYFFWTAKDHPPSTFDAEAVKVTDYCHPDDDGVWPEGVGQIESGHTDAYGWAEGGGCVHRPIREVWAGLFDIPELVRDGVARHALHVLEPEPPFSHQFRLDYEVDDILTVKWTNMWTHEIVEGTHADPRVINVHYRRESGSRLMPYWDGTIVLERLDNGMTAVFVHEEIDTPRGQSKDEETAAINVKGYFKDAATGVPDYEFLDRHQGAAP